MPEAWLSVPEFDEVADNLRRLEADEQLVLTLQLGQFADRDWNPVAEELARYGMAVLQSWIRHRTIFAKVKARTTYVLPILEGWPDHETALNLATDTVVDALNYFRDHVLRTGKWNPAQGASLRTYFIGQCLFKFANPYRLAYKAEIQRRKHELLVDDDTLFGGAQRDVAEIVTVHDEAQAALAQMSSVIARQAAVMQAGGYSIKEIATTFNKSEKQIENMLLYQRNRIRKAS